MTYRQRKQRRRRRRGGAGQRLLILFGIVGAVIAVGGLSVTGYVLAIAATAPDLSELKPADKGSNSEILAADGSRLGYVQSDEIRTPLAWRDMPADMRQAVVAIEDERFYSHKGVDYGGIVRAGVKNLESGKTTQGGSTITQQLVRALYIKDPQRNVQRKIREAKLASELEKKHSKTWILKNYLNDVPFGIVEGRTAIGIEAAAETFFNKHAKDLTRAAAVRHHLETCLRQRAPIGQNSARRRALEGFVAHERSHLALENAVVLPIARLRLTERDLVDLSNRLAVRRGIARRPVSGCKTRPDR